MIQTGQKYALRWQFPHRIDATVVALEQAEVVCEVTHRCDPMRCYLAQMRRSLPIDGELRYRYPDFAKLFEPMAEDAIALPGGR